MTATDRQVRRTSLRLGLQTAALVVGVLAVAGVLLLGLYLHASSRADTAALSSTTSRVDEPNEAPPGIFVTIVSSQVSRSSTALPAGLPDGAAIAAVRSDGRTRQDTYDADGHSYLVRTVRRGDLIIQAALDREERQEEQSRVVTAMLVAGGFGVVMAGLVASWLARRAVRPMADSLAMQHRFVADASHELRTPLTLLSTRVQMLARRGGPPNEEDLTAVVADSRVLSEILDDLLAAADAPSAAPREPVELVSLVDAAVSAANAQAVALGIDLTRTDAPDATVVRASATAVRRAVIALLDNALDHAASRVEVAIHGYRREVRVSVTDDGPGVAPEVLPRLFDRFATGRSAGPLTQERRHFGLGLALVADIAAAHQGRVEAGPRPDGRPGAVLTFVLPRPRRLR